MVCKYIVIALVGLIVSSCAQIGTINGGEKDIAAPKPIIEKTFPQNEAVNFKSNTVTIPFDEYFKLVNPLKNIQIIPPHASLTSSVKRKTLQITWDDALESNTTYAIYLTNAVKDLTEGNDTIIQYVFSTGSFLDTLSFSVGVADAWTGEPILDCVVAMYHPETNKLISFTEPKNGIATLNYLRPGSYHVVAFVDENGDLKPQPFENVGFIEQGVVVLDSSFVDSIPLRVYTPELLPKITAIHQLSSCVFEVDFNTFIESPISFAVNGVQLKETEYELTTPTKGHFKLIRPNTSKLELIVTSNNIHDTIVQRLKPIIDSSLTIEQNISVRYLVDDNKTSLTLNTNGWMNEKNSIDTSQIYLKNSLDSSIVRCLGYSCQGTSVTLDFPTGLEGSYVLICEKGALFSCSKTAGRFEKKITLYSLDAYGEITLDLNNYEGAICVEVLLREELVRTQTFAANDEKLFFLKQLPPGEYSFKVVRDKNQNGRWDVGNYSELIQPEPVDIYSKKTKVRAGWLVNLTLSPKEKVK